MALENVRKRSPGSTWGSALWRRRQRNAGLRTERSSFLDCGQLATGVRAQDVTSKRPGSRCDPHAARGDHFRTFFRRPDPPRPGPSDLDPHLNLGDPRGAPRRKLARHPRRLIPVRAGPWTADRLRGCDPALSRSPRRSVDCGPPSWVRSGAQPPPCAVPSRSRNFSAALADSSAQLLLRSCSAVCFATW